MVPPTAPASRESRRQRLATEGLVAVVRLADPSLVTAAGLALAEGGIRALEITTTVPDFAAQIVRLKAALGGAGIVGAGTLLGAVQDEAAIAAGAEFLVSPVLRPELAAAGAMAGRPVMLGAFTPTECVAARAAGADFVKLFPADALGPGYIRALRAPLPDLPLAPTGGLGLENVAEYRRAGCLLAGIGSTLLLPALVAARDWAGLTRRARAFRDAWDSAGAR